MQIAKLLEFLGCLNGKKMDLDAERGRESRDGAATLETCNLFPVARPHQDQLDQYSRTILDR